MPEATKITADMEMEEVASEATGTPEEAIGEDEVVVIIVTGAATEDIRIVDLDRNPGISHGEDETMEEVEETTKTGVMKETATTLEVEESKVPMGLKEKATLNEVTLDRRTEERISSKIRTRTSKAKVGGSMETIEINLIGKTTLMKS